MPRKKSPNGTGRLGRDKKKKVLELEEYKKTVEELTQRKVTSEDIQKIYDRCQERKQTKITIDTLTFKLLELINYFDSRNEGIREEDRSYIGKDDIVQMIIKNPRIITSDIRNNIIIKCEILTNKKDSVQEANTLIKSNPGVFRKTVKDIKDGR